MPQENNPQGDKTFVNSKIALFNSFIKQVTGDEHLTEEQIEIRRTDYWKCKACGKLNQMDVKVCRKCDSTRPDKVEHPGKEELRKNLLKENQSVPLVTGLIFFFASGVFLLSGYIWDSHNDTWPDLITLAFTAVSSLSGTILIIYWLFRKIKGI